MKLTCEEIEKMEAGREMDALIAEKVMGWEWWHFNKRSHLSAHESEPFYLEAGWMRGKDDNTPITDTSSCLRYSTDIAAAWRVVEKMEEQDIDFHLSNVIPGSDAIVYECEFAKVGVIHYACEGSAQLAICRAALLAVMETE